MVLQLRNWWDHVRIHWKSRVVMDTDICYICGWFFSILVVMFFQRVLCWYLFGSCPVGDLIVAAEASND